MNKIIKESLIIITILFIILLIIEATIIAENIRVKKQNEFLKGLISTSLIHQKCSGEVCIDYDAYSYQNGFCYCFLNNEVVYREPYEI